MALARLAARAEPEVEAIRQAVRASPVINSDETGVLVDGRTWWHWVFQTPTAGYHAIAPSRGAEQGAIFATLPTTARKLGHNAYARLCAIAGPSPLLAAGPAA